MNPTCSRADRRRQSQALDQADVEPRGKEAGAGNRDQMRDRLRPRRGQLQRPCGSRLGQGQRLFRIALHSQGGCRAAIRRPRCRRVERLSRSAPIAGFQEHAAATPDAGPLKQGGQKPRLAPVGQECPCNAGRRRLLDRLRRFRGCQPQDRHAHRAHPHRISEHGVFRARTNGEARPGNRPSKATTKVPKPKWRCIQMAA